MKKPRFSAQFFALTSLLFVPGCHAQLKAPESVSPAKADVDMKQNVPKEYQGLPLELIDPSVLKKNSPKAMEADVGVVAPLVRRLAAEKWQKMVGRDYQSVFEMATDASKRTHTIARIVPPPSRELLGASVTHVGCESEIACTVRIDLTTSVIVGRTAATKTQLTSEIVETWVRDAGNQKWGFVIPTR